MVRIVYKIDELLDLRHKNVVKLNQVLPKSLLGTSDNRFGKVHQHTKKSVPKLKNTTGNNSYCKTHTSHFMKENKYVPNNLYVNFGMQTSTQNSIDNNTPLSTLFHPNNCYDPQIQYPFFNLLMFPPGSRIIRIEPGNPLPKGAIPIPFRFEDEFSNPADTMKRVFVNRSNLYLNELQKSTIDNAKYNKYKNIINLHYPIESKNLQTSKNQTIKPISNPYSVTGFFPERDVEKDTSMVENTNTYKPRIFTHALPNNSQTSINDTDSSETIGSSSCDSFNIQIQISATH